MITCTSFTVILADYIKRYYQLKGFNVFLSTGTDEHGIKMMKTATALGIKDPQILADENSAAFKEMMKLSGISYDNYIRTTERIFKIIIP